MGKERMGKTKKNEKNTQFIVRKRHTHKQLNSNCVNLTVNAKNCAFARRSEKPQTRPQTTNK